MGATLRSTTVPKELALTYDEYLLLPEDGYRYEILEGDLVMTPAPNPRHQNVLRNLVRIIDLTCLAEDLGTVYFAPIDVILDQTTIIQPDLVFIRKARLAIVTERGIEGVPDLVVEILSPGTARRDRIIKARIYARHGVSDYWLVDPDHRTLEAFHLGPTRYRKVASLRGKQAFHPLPFPDLAIRLTDLWK